MKISWPLLGLAVGVVAVAGGCKDKKKADAADGSTTVAGKPVTQPTTDPVGQLDPFARLSTEAGKALDRGWKATKSKKWEDAQQAFTEVVAASPDYVPARWALVRALVLGNNLPGVALAFEGLLSRDYVGYANRLDKGKEFAALRASPEWAKIEALKTRYAEAYLVGLDKGFFFVARTRAANEVKPGGGGEATLDLKQEIYHYGEETKRFRRLTETDGHAFALDLTRNRKQLTFLVATKLKRDKSSDAFVDPKVGVIDLDTMQTFGPYVQKGTYSEVALGQDASNLPLFTFSVTGGESKTYTLDTAKTGLALVGAGNDGGETRAQPGQVQHSTSRVLAGVKIADGANQFTLETEGQPPVPVVAARPLQASSVDWSPSKTRITYAGKLDACKILATANPKDKEKNELYVYEVAKKTAQRVAAGVSGFESLWLDDDRLVYESGVGKDGQLHIYTFSTHADQALPTRHGAGLYGVPTLACEKADVADPNEAPSEEAPDSEGD